METQAEYKANQKIYKKAIEKWGEDLQISMVFEEMAELQKELCKNLRGRDNKLEIAEEVADVEIMLEQLKIIFNIDEAARRHKIVKISRLKDRVSRD